MSALADKKDFFGWGWDLGFLFAALEAETHLRIVIIATLKSIMS